MGFLYIPTNEELGIRKQVPQLLVLFPLSVASDALTLPSDTWGFLHAEGDE